MRRTLAAQSGQLSVLVLGLAMLLFAVAGVAVDGTRAFLLRRSLQNAADGSALAGAGEVDVHAYYRTAGREVILEPLAARRAALEWLARRSLPAEAAVAADTGGLRVRLAGRMDTSFLALIGLRSIEVAAEAEAEPVD
ncbi:MAG: hypothetical protein H0W21_02105 [Actinobacteria bacterium]|nr:hypothetical protein [Actinomycetota bacterium]